MKVVYFSDGQAKELEALRRLQSDHTRWFSQEEFERINVLVSLKKHNNCLNHKCETAHVLDESKVDCPMCGSTLFKSQYVAS